MKFLNNNLRPTKDSIYKKANKEYKNNRGNLQAVENNLNFVRATENQINHFRLV